MSISFKLKTMKGNRTRPCKNKVCSTESNRADLYNMQKSKQLKMLNPVKNRTKIWSNRKGAADDSI